MNYPVWDVPIMGSGLVIALIATTHVFVSHFAIGGGFYLPLLEATALRKGRRDWLAVAKRHSLFFMVLTNAFGVVSGVGIWFAIGLANPEATSTLIHYWVLGWAIEWIAFIVEVTAAAAYYYLWDRVSDALHLKIGWIYAISSWLSLVLINGILTFMLTPTSAWVKSVKGGHETDLFWHAFFNPTYWPSLCVRTLICFSFAGVFALITASFMDRDNHPELKVEIIQWSRRWLVPLFLLMPLCMAWYGANIPASQRELLLRGVTTISAGMFTQVTRMAIILTITAATTAVVAFLFTSMGNALDLGPGKAIAIAVLAYLTIGSTETIREMIRKPYVISHHMYSNGVRPTSVDEYNKNGYLSTAIWTLPGEKDRWALQDALVKKGHGHFQQIDRGQLMFRGECMSCHTLDGYRPMRELVKGRDRKNVMNLLGLLHSPTADSPYRAYMPPLVGTQPEIQALADYLISLNPPEPHKAPATAPQEAPTSAPKKAPGPAAVAVLPKG